MPDDGVRQVNEKQHIMFNKFKLLGVVVLLAATTLMFASCQKTEDKLVGKWKITKAPSDASEDKGETWTFKEGGSCSILLYGIDFEGTWSVSGDKGLTIDLDPITMEEEKISGTGDLTIDELTKDALSVSGSFTIKWTDTYYGESGTEKMKANYDFERK